MVYIIDRIHQLFNKLKGGLFLIKITEKSIFGTFVKKQKIKEK
jgi:hypothetical protein